MGITAGQIRDWYSSNPGVSDAQIAAAMDQYGVSPAQFAGAFQGLTETEVQNRYNATGGTRWRPPPPPAPVAPTYTPAIIPSAPTYTAAQLPPPVRWDITPQQTVAGQLQPLLASGSPLMSLAATQANQQAQSRGLLNSSLAVGAGQNALIQNALPIATSDADVYARSAGYNAQTPNQFAQADVLSQNQARQFNAGNQLQVAMANANAQNQAGQFNTGNQFQSQQAQLERNFNQQQTLFQANVQASLDQIANEANFNRQSQAIYGTLSSDFSKAISAINTDTNMDQQSKDYSIRQLFDVYRAQISMLSAVGSVPDVSELLIAA